MAGLPWIERTWSFDYPAGQFPCVVERLRGTPARLEEAVARQPGTLLRRRFGDGWPILRHVAHLVVLEELPAVRLDDFLSGAKVLTAADMTNRATEEVDLESTTIDDLLAQFRSSRSALVELLDGLNPDDWERSARHPRLDVPMRLVDMCLFQADHDDHHLASIRELLPL